MGDWDRHRKQWRWAKLPGNPSWVPIPEDRDQAFSRYEGAALASGRGRDPRFQKFGPKYSNIGGLTFNGSEQDRRLLVGAPGPEVGEVALIASPGRRCSGVSSEAAGPLLEVG